MWLRYVAYFVGLVSTVYPDLTMMHSQPVLNLGLV